MSKSSAKRLILVGKYYIIEPLGILYLLGLARRLGWQAEVVLVKDGDFQPLYDEIARFQPDLVGFSIWTGYHGKAFAACDRIRASGIPIVIGGPHATYFTDECAQHADWVIKAESFRNFRRLLEGDLPRGVHFDETRMAEGFPQPDRDLLYTRYPVLGASPIKSIFCSVGCPFHCSYCYAPKYNEMYGGFALNLRPIDDVIEEALAIRDRWPLQMIYMQDDIFGFNIPWLREFVKQWKARVGVPWHCQIRLELTRDIERLELFAEGGCTGITLAIESGNDFLRRYVLLRPMPDDLIVEGVRKVQKLGMALRTQQILAVPFSDIETDIEALALNNRIDPDIAWCSILAPYGGTAMGTIAKDFGFYEGNNDDLTESFFNRSVLRHTEGGRASLEAVVRAATKSPADNPLMRMALRRTEGRRDGKAGPPGADVYWKDEAFGRVLSTAQPVAHLEYLDDAANDRYCEQTVMLQRVFNGLAKVPEGHKIAARLVALDKPEWTWRRLGELTREHLDRLGLERALVPRMRALAEGLGATMETLPAGVADNPWFFAFLPSGPEFARHLVERGAFDPLRGAAEVGQQFDLIGYETRQWIYDHAVYRTHPSTPPAPLVLDDATALAPAHDHASAASSALSSG